MVGFSKYCLLAFTAVTLSFPANVAAQSRRSSSAAAGSGSEQSKHSAAAKGERRALVLYGER